MHNPSHSRNQLTSGHHGINARAQKAAHNQPSPAASPQHLGPGTSATLAALLLMMGAATLRRGLRVFLLRGVSGNQ